MDNNCQKIKLLKIVEIMRRETDEQHPITTNDFCNRLIDMNITCDRRTLARDMALLAEEGYGVKSRMQGHEKAYFMEASRFTVPEIKLMIDAVQAAGFVTEKKTAELIEKLAELGGEHRSEIIRSSLVTFNIRKHTNEAVYNNIETLETALRTGHQVSFLYFDLNENGERVYRKEGRRYKAIPAALIYHEDNYYLVCYNHTYRSTTNYRVDRMDDMQMMDAMIDEDTLMELRELDMSEYTREVFKMYAGLPANVRLRFDDSLIGAVYDKFGEQIKMTRVDEHTCEVKVKLQISPTFFGWIFQFGDKMEIVSPNRVLAQYRMLAGKLLCRIGEPAAAPDDADEDADGEEDEDETEPF